MIPLKDDLPAGRAPVLTIALIAANVVVFLWQLSFGLQESVFRAGAIPYEILTLEDVNERDLVAPPFTILTSMFMHGGFAHIGSNMLFLWIFGKNVEDALGPLRFIGFYLLAGIAAALAQTAAAGVSGDELALGVPMVGASGAIAGVLAAYVVLFSQARVLAVIIFFFIQVRYVPATLFIGFWFVGQVIAVIFGGDPGVAVFAHLGGFVTGFLLVRVMGRRTRWRARRVSW